LLPVAAVVGILAGTAVFLSAKVYHPPDIDHLDLEYWDLLGTRVPTAALTTLDGRTVSSRPFGTRAYVLFFSEPGCSLCDSVYHIVEEAAARVPTLMVFPRDTQASRALVARRDIRFPVAYDSLGSLSGPLHVRGYPAAVWVGDDGRIRKGALGREDVEVLMRRAVEAQASGTPGAGP
jgi:hypothetical protein